MKNKAYEVLTKLLDDYYDDVVEAHCTNSYLILTFDKFIISAYGLNDRRYNIIVTYDEVEYSQIDLPNICPYANIKYEIDQFKKLGKKS